MDKKELRDLAMWVRNSALEYVEALEADGRLEAVGVSTTQTVAKQTVAEIKERMDKRGLAGFDSAVVEKLERTFVTSFVCQQTGYRRLLLDYDLD